MGTETTQHRGSAELRLNVILSALGIDKSQMADELKIDRTTLHKVISGQRKSPQVRAAISKFIAAKIDGLWPAPIQESNDQ